jgi:hypothetical protein
MFSVHTWLTSVTRTVFESSPPPSPPQAARPMATTTAREVPIIGRRRTLVSPSVVAAALERAATSVLHPLNIGMLGRKS